MFILQVFKQLFNGYSFPRFQKWHTWFLWCLYLTLSCQLKILSVNSRSVQKKLNNYLSIHPHFLVKLCHFNFILNAYYNFNLCLYIIINFSGPSELFFWLRVTDGL